MSEERDYLLRTWDALDAAAAAIVLALPHQMTKAAENLERTRLEMRAAVMAWGAKK